MQELISKNTIRKFVKKLGKQITKEYSSIEKPLILIGILKGSVIFMADLIREIKLPVNIDFMMISSYGPDNIQEKEIKIILDLNTPIADRDVIILEDILDSGRTFSKILTLLKSRNPRSLKTCALLNKKECRVVDVHLDFGGIEIPDKYVYGYGLDDNQLQRNLPYIEVKDDK